MGFDINSLISSAFNLKELDLLKSSNIDLDGFIKDYKSLLDDGIDSIKFVDDLKKLNDLGLDVKSLSDLDKVKNLDANKLLTNSIDIKSLQKNLSKLQNNGINISSFKDQVSKIKVSGLDINKFTNLASTFDIKSLTGGLTSQFGNVLGGLSGQANNVLGGLTGQLGGLVGQGTNILGGLADQGKNILGGLTGQLGGLAAQGKNILGGLTGKGLLTGSLTNKLPLDALKSSQLSLTTNTNIVSVPKTVALKVLVPSQYLDVYVLSKWGGEPALVTTKESKQMVWYDKDFDRPDFVPSNLTNPSKTNDDGNGDFGINIHLGYPGGKKVGNWSEDGSQCFSTSDELKDFFDLCDKHVTLNGNKFTYTLVIKDDWEQASKNAQANKLISREPTPPQLVPREVEIISTSQSTSLNNEIISPDSKVEGDVKTNDIKTDDKKSTDKETTKSNITKPTFFPSISDVIAFQIWSNKNKNSLAVDGKWTEETNNVWVKISSTYKKSLTIFGTTKYINDSDLRMIHARLSPYGSATPLSDGTYMYQASFTQSKLSVQLDYSLQYIVNFYNNARFIILDNSSKLVIAKGSYSNGGRTLIVTEGRNAKKTFKEDNAWNAIRKIAYN